MRIEPLYNPLDKKNLGISVADALLAKALGPLPPEEPFIGAGVYAIYYSGNFPAYQRMSLKHGKARRETPIYVGKAIPAGGRKGVFDPEIQAGAVLYNRLAEHGESIKQARNLEVADFSCRYLVVDDIWIPLGETLLIQTFSPLWNRVIDGFGNHDPGRGRHQGQRPQWDVLHPGRPWADRLQPNKKTKDEILASVDTFLTAQPKL